MTLTHKLRMPLTTIVPHNRVKETSQSTGAISYEARSRQPVWSVSKPGQKPGRSHDKETTLINGGNRWLVHDIYLWNLYSAPSR